MILNTWYFWVIIYLVSAVIFAHSFKVANKKMKDASVLTVLIELCAALFSILFIPIFKFSFPTDIGIYITLLIVTIIYAITDRLNIEARYGLDPSVFSMLKQLSTVFLVIFGFIILKEDLIINKIFGAIIIIVANIFLAYDKGKIRINKYFIMSFISNFLFAIAMLINVNISDNFNLGIYTIITLTIPALIISLFSRISIKKIKKEFKRYDIGYFILSGFTWSLMLISSVRAYQLGSVTVIAPLFALTSIFNSFVEFIFNKNRNKLIHKLIAAILILIGVILIKI